MRLDVADGVAEPTPAGHRRECSLWAHYDGSYRVEPVHVHSAAVGCTRSC